MTEPRDISGRCLGSRWGVVLLVGVLFFAFFFDLWGGDRVFCYRDIGHFYYPLWKQTNEAMSHGRLPLWDPTENFGVPLAANPTSAIFYPGRLIFFAANRCGLSFATCLNGYILAHLLLAFFAMRFLARRCDISSGGAIFAALAYTFGGSVLFQYSNPVFLVGAAWFPLIVAAGMKLVEAPRIAPIGWLAATLAMSVLGGDPQIAYLAGVILVAYAIFLPREKMVLGQASSRYVVVKRLSLLILAGFFGILLAAVQVFPAIEWAERSDRAVRRDPLSVWEEGAKFFVGEKPHEPVSTEPFFLDASRSESRRTDGIFCRNFEEDATLRSIYSFSIGPWRWLEFLWPEIGGSPFPLNARWFDRIANDRRFWTPTLYFGLIPFLFAVGAMRFRGERHGGNFSMPDAKIGARSRFLRRFFTGATLLATFAALGAYAPAWLFRVVTDASSDPASWQIQNGDPVGGVYWLMTQLLPGFISFRYPAKWMTVAAVGFSLLAAFGWDRFFSSPYGAWGRTLSRWGMMIAMVSVCLWGLVSFGGGVERLSRILGGFPEGTVFGPCDPNRLATVLSECFLQTAIVAGLFVLLARIVRDKKNPRKPPSRIRMGGLEWVLLAVTAGDLFFAARGTILTCPVSVFQQESSLATLIHDTEDGGLPRVWRGGDFFPRAFRDTGSVNRPGALMLWESATLFPKFAALHRCATLDVRGTMTPAETAQFLPELAARIAAPNRHFPIEAALELLDTHWLILPDDTPPPSKNWLRIAEPTDDRSARLPCGTSLWRLNRLDENKIKGRVRIFHEEPLGNGTWESLFGELSARSPLPGDSVKVLLAEPEQIVVEATLAAEGWLLFAEQFWPGWEATAIGESSHESVRLTVHRECRFLRRINLPKGSWRVTMRYRPERLYFGMVTSAAAWAFFLLGGVIFYRRLKVAQRIQTYDMTKTPLF